MEVFDPVRTLDARLKSQPEYGFAYKLDQPTQYGMDASFGDSLDIDESTMSIVIPFADGNRRDLLLPISSCNNVTDCCPCDFSDSTFDFTNSETFFVKTSDQFNVVVSQFSSRPSTSSIVGLESGSVNNCVFHIFGTCPPSKIVEFIVTGFPIREMARFFVCWFGSDECDQYEMVKFSTFSFIISPQIDVCTPIEAVEYFYVTSFDSPFSVKSVVGVCNSSGQGFNSSKIRNSVIPFVTGNISPVFDFSIRMNLFAFVKQPSTRISCRHDHIPYMAPYEVDGQAVGITALRVYSPSPRYCSKSITFMKEVR